MFCAVLADPPHLQARSSKNVLGEVAVAEREPVSLLLGLFHGRPCTQHEERRTQADTVRE
jgi:hypothetical protein